MDSAREHHRQTLWRLMAIRSRMRDNIADIGSARCSVAPDPSLSNWRWAHGNGITQVKPMARRSRLSHAVVRRLALQLPQTIESMHFDRPDFRVRNKIFATLPSDVRAVVLKSTAPNIDALVARDPETFWDEWRGRWLGIRLDGVSRTLLRNLVIDSWKLVAPKRLAAALKSDSSGA